MLECAGWRRPESEVVVKKGTVVKKATVKRTSESRVRAKVVASRPSITTNRAWIYVASHTEHFAELEDGSTSKWCVFRHNDAIDEAWLAIRGAIEAGRLALGKVSTRLTAPMHENTHVPASIAKIGATTLGPGFCDQKVTKRNTKFFCDLWMSAYDCQLVDLRSQRVYDGGQPGGFGVDFRSVRRYLTQHEDDCFYEGAAYTAHRDPAEGQHRAWPGV
jgi:hypothetical protein